MHSFLSRINRLSLVTCAALACAASPAFAADALLAESRPLFLTDRVTPAAAPAGYSSGVLPQSLVTLRGEREGFQFAMRNTTGAALSLDARIVPDPALAAQQAAGAVSWELLRIGFVNVPKGSTNLGTRGGLYADPMPPLTDSANGRLGIAANAWGAVAPIMAVRTTAAPGTYGATLEVFSGDTVYARLPFSLKVVNAVDRSGAAQPLLQPGSKNAMKTVLGVEGEAYWLGHDGMRNGPFKGYASQPDRMAQLEGLVQYLGEHGVTPSEMPFGNPSKSGSYRDCSFALRVNDGAPPTVSFAEQLSRYFVQRSGRSATGAADDLFPTRMLPHRTNGCDLDKQGDEYEAIQDIRRTGERQDDVLRPDAARFMSTVYNQWKVAGWLPSQKTNSYVKHPFDEPGDATPAQRRTMNIEVPRATKMLRQTVGNDAKVVLAGWPRDNRRAQVCKKIAGKQSCVSAQRDDFSNMKMWDGKGLDDPQVWVPPFSRLYGRKVNPVLAQHGWRRDIEYRNRLSGIQKLPGDREIWAYNFYTATPNMPQLTIDAPGSDTRFQYWLLAREGHTGLYVSNSMMGWGNSPERQPGQSILRKGNPWDEALYFRHKTYGYAAGWGTFYYPGFRPQVGLDQEERRNSVAAAPVTSLRMEGMRDGQEDANLARMYRDRYGDAKTVGAIRTLVPEKMCAKLPASLGNAVFPCYNNTRMSQRMAQVRLSMIDQLARP